MGVDDISYAVYLKNYPEVFRCRRFGLSTFRSVDVSVCRRFGLSTFRSVDVLVCRRFGLSTFWFVDGSVCRRFSLSTFRFVDVLVCRRFGCRRFSLSTFWLVTLTAINSFFDDLTLSGNDYQTYISRPYNTVITKIKAWNILVCKYIWL